MSELSVSGNVWRLAQCSKGCWQVQREMDSKDDEMLVFELKGHVVAASQHRHANHVLQKAIMTTRPRALQFVINELASVPLGQVARHRYGCRVIQRLLEKCLPDQLVVLVNSLLEDSAETLTLCRHIFANCVMQCLIDRGTDQQRLFISHFLLDNMRALACDIYGCKVLMAGLTRLDDRDCTSLAHQLADDTSLMTFLETTQFGAELVMQVKLLVWS